MSVASRASIVQGLVVMTINPLRTALSTLGIVIGIASVIATLALTDGLDRYVREQLATLTDVQSITIASKTEQLEDGFSLPLRGFPIFGLGDARDLQRSLGANTEVTMIAAGNAVIGSASAPPHVSTVVATLANYLAFNRKDLAAGRFFTDGEETRNAPVVVLSYKLATELSPNGDPAMMIGRTVRVRGRPVTAVGVMPAFTGERTFQVFVPVRAAAVAFGAHQPVTPSLVVRAPRMEAVEATTNDIDEWLATRYRNWSQRVTVTASLDRLEQARTGMLILKLIMGSIAGISLVVGGVGIMNVLLASVAERTREIGVRKALGARQRDILYQFLAESVAIASIGTGLGTTIGFALAFALAAFFRLEVPGAPLHAVVTLGTLMTAIVAAGSIGLSFGIFPAVRASRLSPIDAIRHD